MRNAISVIVGTAIVATIAAFPAHAACSRPSPPACTASSGHFQTSSEQKGCDRAVEVYKSKVENFLSCMIREGNDNEGAIRAVFVEYSEAVAGFNRRARQ